MTRRPNTSLIASPALIGAIALFVLIVGLFISSKATTELPFVPKYRLEVEAPNAALTTKGADVLLGGSRVGRVSKVVPDRDADGKPVAKMSLVMDKDLEPLPADSTFAIRPRGSIARKAIEINLGTSDRGIANEATVPAKQAKPVPVDIDDVLAMFDDKTRHGARASLGGLGFGLAGRGRDLNATIPDLNPLLAHLQPVMTDLADPDTNLARLIRGFSSFYGELAPVSGEAASLMRNLDTTFGSFASVARPYLQDTISQSPDTFQAGIEEIPRIRPFVRSATTLLDEFQPSANVLADASAPLADGFKAGAQNLPGVPALGDRLVATSHRVVRYSDTPSVRSGLVSLTETADSLHPLVTFIAPAQYTCNYFALLIRNLASLAKEDHATGTSLRVAGVVIEAGENSESGPSSGPAAKEAPAGEALGPVHSNPYPNSASPGQTRECEAGKEPYVHNQILVGNVPGNQGTKTEGGELP